MAKVTVSTSELATLIAAVSRGLDRHMTVSIAHSGSPGSEVDISPRVRENLIMMLVVGRGGRIKYGDPARVSLAGITSTSTMGVVGAARNWCTAARKHLEGTQ